MTKSSNSKPFVLLTNDDGIDSPGLQALAASISPFAEVCVVAPSHQMTAAGRGLSGSRKAVLESKELKVNDHFLKVYHAPCSPAQVVILAIEILCRDRSPDLLISGINYGENMGRDITMSGTVGAAIQGVCMGVPSLAVSLQVPIDMHFKHGEANWDSATFFATKFAKLALERTFPEDVDLFKIDVPQSATSETPWLITKQAKQNFFVAQFENPDLSSSLSDSKITALSDPETLEKGTDIHTVAVKNHVSVTPISLDFTARTDFNKLQVYLENNHE